MSIVDLDNKLEEHLPAGISSHKSEFGISFLDVFKKGFKGNARTKLVSGHDNHSPYEDGLLLKNAIHYHPTAPGGDLHATLNELQSSKESLKHKVRYLITFDGRTVAARDVREGDSMVCALDDLKHEFFFFSVLYGEPRYVAASENKADQDAAIALSKIYSALRQSDPEWAAAYSHDVNTFMTRLLFCLFAEDIELFEKDLFTKTLVSRSGQYGEHAQEVIGDIYRILNTPKSKREGESSWLARFPYVNGDVFALDGIHIPKFNIQAFHYLKEAGDTIDWKQVHPDILGSAIQKITDPSERHSLGMHYTSVTNIDKLLGPLFLDDLREARAKANASGVRRISNLKKLLVRLGAIKVFDPACGSGNFLVIAYKRMRDLEIQILNDLEDAGVQQVDLFSTISLSNFYGIEFADFAAETAKVSLRIAEQQMDSAYGERFNRPTVCLPLRSAPNIHTGSALAVDWNEICPSTFADEVYICGNPPYLGFGSRNSEQQDEHLSIMEKVHKSVKQLDYVCSWFVKASDFIEDGQSKSFAFVSTNSIVQGVHVPRLWPYIINKGLFIQFAYKSFKWSNLAGKNAGVSCVIIGVSSDGTKERRLITGSVSESCTNINPYLANSVNTWIDNQFSSISSFPKMLLGNAPKDGGNLHLTPAEKDELLELSPEAHPLIRRIVGSQEALKGIERYCLWVGENNIELAQSVPEVKERIERVKEMRLGSKKEATRKSASTPHRFDEVRHKDSGRTLVVPLVSSERRQFMPIFMADEGEIVNNNAYMIADAENWHFSILSSRIHRVWQMAVGSCLKTDYRYSNTMVWNTFPMPDLTDDQKAALNKTGQGILNARHFHPDLTLGDMYNPENMGEELLAAHKENDRVMEAIFRDKPFKNDEDRLAYLFECYAEMTKGE